MIVARPAETSLVMAKLQAFELATQYQAAEDTEVPLQLTEANANSMAFLLNI